MTTHTPQPWRIDFDGPSLPIITAGGTGHPQEIVALIRSNAAYADASLIAAAPDLLAALEAVTNMLAKPEYVARTDGAALARASVIIAADAAIAKARGQQVPA